MLVYLDNAATTPLEPKVREAMLETMDLTYGNPSSIHSLGRQARTQIEQARKTVAQILGAAPAEIFFTSSGTEADNTALVKTIEDHGIQHIVSSPTEHHAVLHTIEFIEKHYPSVKVTWLQVNEKGEISLEELDKVLSENPKSLVSLMHANNEIGTMIDLEEVSRICKEHQAIFHTDTVQSLGHFNHNLHDLNVNFIAGSAHKLHGPKGIGLLYINQNTKISPFIHGGSQERNMRGGTENLTGIIGFAKALEIANENKVEDYNHILNLKRHMRDSLIEQIPGVSFNGACDNLDKSLITVLNVSLPFTNISDMLLFKLDIAGICASGGSACSSGSEIGSHVLGAIKADSTRPNVRFSFSKYNTLDEINYVVEKLKEIGK